MKGEESFLQILTSLSSLFPDNFLSGFFMLFFQREEMPQALCLVCDVSNEMPLCLDCIEMNKCRQPLCVGYIATEIMPQALDNGSQPYRKAFRFFEMAGGRAAPNNIACLYGRRHGQPLSLTQRQGFGCGVALSSHLLSLASRTVTVGSPYLQARLYGWLPLSDASGIFFANDLLASFLCWLPLSLIFNL